MSSGQSLLKHFAEQQNSEQFRQEYCRDPFAEYLDLVRERPEIARSAHQRMYDSATRTRKSTKVEDSIREQFLMIR